MDVITEKQNLRYLKWAHARSSSGTAGTFLKAESKIGNEKNYYKLSNYDTEKGVVGFECIYEIIVDRLLTILGVSHLSYTLINADIEIDGKVLSTYLCQSKDFKKEGESKIALDDYYRTMHLPGESSYDFCKRNGWQEYIDQMLAVDYIILNRDRHGANIEVLRNSKEHSLRIAPLFDHGLSLLAFCHSDTDALAFDPLADLRCNNFIGSSSCFENLQLIENVNVFSNLLKEEDKEKLFDGLDILSPIMKEKIWEMIWNRYRYYESL